MLEHRFLAVEDNQVNRELLCDRLAVEGQEVPSRTELKASTEVFAMSQIRSYVC